MTAPPPRERSVAEALEAALTDLAAGAAAQGASGARASAAMQRVRDLLESLGPPGSGFTPQRIKGYLFNKISTPQEEDVGVFKWAVSIKMLSTMDKREGAP